MDIKTVNSMMCLVKLDITAVLMSVDHSRDVTLSDMKRIFVMQRPYKVLVMAM